ncbi:hypothetical protein BKA64DRAFT_757318 [Cadophora sp. MPI-SDFR-AT-0126]|nr:hypothetical protein BKA64DRAFT_757318 [Leotiomycetes sp. MPI-SDFR-AT-0126]
MVSRDAIYKAFEAEAKPKRIFSITEKEEKVVLVRHPAMTQAERKLRSTRIPTILQETHLTTSRQLMKDAAVELIPNRLYEVEFPSNFGGSGEVGSVIKLSMEKLQELGLLDEFLEVRAELLHKDKLHFLQGYQMKKKAGSILFSNLQRRQDEWNGKSINDRLMKLVSKATKMVIPSISGGGREERWHAVASMTPYWEDNQEVTSIQLNYTPQASSVKESIKKFAVSHTDTGDDPTGYSGLCMMGHLDDDQFAGRFNLTPLGLTTLIGKCEMLLFPAKLWIHCSSGSGTYADPPNDPRRLSPSPLDHFTRLPKETPFMRLNAIMFPNKRCLNPTWRQIHPELFSDKGRDIFPSTRAHQECMLDRAKATRRGVDPAQKNYEDINAKMEENDDKVERAARAAGLLCEDPKVKAARGRKENTANDKLRDEHNAEERDLELPSQECARKTVEWSGKPNKKFPNLLDKDKYLDCGTRVSNVPRGSVIPKVTWTNPGFDRKFNRVTDTSPGYPTWQPVAVRHEALRKWRMERSVMLTAQKRVYGQAFLEEGYMDEANAKIDDENKDNSDPVSPSPLVLPRKKALDIGWVLWKGECGKKNVVLAKSIMFQVREREGS